MFVFNHSQMANIESGMFLWENVKICLIQQMSLNVVTDGQTGSAFNRRGQEDEGLHGRIQGH